MVSEMEVTLRVILVIVCLVLLGIAALPKVLGGGRPGWLHFGWAGMFVLALLLLITID